MQLTAREWIELIADPEIREKVKGWVRDYPHTPDAMVYDIKLALYVAINQNNMSPKMTMEYYNMRENPPALLPFPNKEREAAESVLVDFWEYYGGNVQMKQFINEFLNQKYPS